MARPIYEDLLAFYNVNGSLMEQTFSDDLLMEFGSQLDEWEELALCLQIPSSEIEDIKSQGGKGMKGIRLLQCWKRMCGFKATYKALVNALLQINRADLAEKVVSLQSQLAAILTSPVVASPLFTINKEIVITRLKELQYEFFELIVFIETTLKYNEVQTTTIIRRFRILPQSIKTQCQRDEQFVKIRHRILNSKTIKELFDHLTELKNFNYMFPDILKHILKDVNINSIHEKIDKYIGEVTTFKRNTKLRELIGISFLVPDYCMELAMVVEGWEDKTIEQVENRAMNIMRQTKYSRSPHVGLGWKGVSSVDEKSYTNLTKDDNEHLTDITGQNDQWQLQPKHQQDIIITAEEKKHIAAVQMAMEKRGTLDHTVVHGVFVGCARSGKNSLMERLLGRMPSSVSPSTGVAESVVQVKVIQKSATFAANVEELVWSEMDYDDETIKLMLINSESQNETHISSSDKLDSEDGMREEPQSASTQPNPPVMQPSPTLVDKPPKLPDSYVSPIEIFKKAVKNKGYGSKALQQHFERTWSLYLTNTGGQIEFQEVLPLLVSGPSLFFFTFRLDRDLHEYYTIEYEHSDGKKSHPYKSTVSTIDGMLQTLASISAMGTFVYSGLQRRDKPLRPKVFFVGTHKDLLDNELADEHITRVDKQLQKAIRSTACYKELVEHASESRLIFTVNNFSENDSDFKCIHSAVQRIVARNEFQMTCPTHWLIFSLALRKLSDRVISYDTCLEIAKRCGISDNELDEALHFLHSKMGLVRYFPYEHIKSLVFIDPQFLFDKVTDLIVSTFIFEKVGMQESKQFEHKGIFLLEKLDEVSNQGHSGSIMSTFQFGKLLERLRIVAPLTIAKVIKYFLPCVLAHASESDLACDTTVPTLLISFECGYVPKGVPGALITYLMESELDSPIEWTLLTDKIFKNEVSFCVGPYDTVMFRILPTHVEITCIPDAQFNDERDDLPIEETCTIVLKILDSGIKQIFQDLNYITQHYITFPCQADGCSGGHPAQLNWLRGSPRNLQCSTVGKRFKLPTNVNVWKPALQALNEDKHKELRALSSMPSKTQTKQACLALSESHISNYSNSTNAGQQKSLTVILNRDHYTSLIDSQKPALQAKNEDEQKTELKTSTSTPSPPPAKRVCPESHTSSCYSLQAMSEDQHKELKIRASSSTPSPPPAKRVCPESHTSSCYSLQAMSEDQHKELKIRASSSMPSPPPAKRVCPESHISSSYSLQAMSGDQHKELTIRASSSTPSPPPAKRVCLKTNAVPESRTSAYSITRQQETSHIARLNSDHLACLLQQLTEDASKWKEIGIYLGFRSGELDNIQSHPLSLSQAPVSWLSAMLAQWLQWAPGDSRGSTSYATLEDLKTALNLAGLGVTAHDLRNPISSQFNF